MMTEKQIYNRCKEIFAADGKEFKNIEVRINGRLRATLGRCHYVSICGIVSPTKIEISRALLESEDEKEIDETIIHECAHALVAIDTLQKHGHDSYFKAKCQKLGIAGNRCASGNRADTPDQYKYVVSCAECGKITTCYYRAGNVVKYPQMYRSKCCGAALKIAQNY